MEFKQWDGAFQGMENCSQMLQLKEMIYLVNILSVRINLHLGLVFFHIVLLGNFKCTILNSNNLLMRKNLRVLNVLKFKF